MQVSFRHDPARVNQRHPHTKVGHASNGNGNGNCVFAHPPETNAKTIESASRESERANSDSRGLLLLDAYLRLLSANEEAVSILCYPESMKDDNRLGDFLVKRISSLLPGRDRSFRAKFCSEFVSGKRRYLIKVFTLKSPLGKRHGPTLAVLLERNVQSLVLHRIGQKFRLTQRETEALELLMHGYTTKQIASRMDITPNTAKTFLRSVMFKTGACDRSGILATILQLSKGALP